MKNRVYWDSCVFIALLRQEEGRYHACEYHRRCAENGEIDIVTSAVSLAEVCKPSGERLEEEQRRQIMQFFRNPYILLQAVDRRVGELANELRCQHDGLMPMDAIHVASALRSQTREMHTYDSKKNRRRGLLRLNGKVGDPPLWIMEPPSPPTHFHLDESVRKDQFIEVLLSQARKRWRQSHSVRLRPQSPRARSRPGRFE